MRNSDNSSVTQSAIGQTPHSDAGTGPDKIAGRIHSVETLGALDGPGLRYVLFMQGCPFRCGFCHNPDTWDVNSGYEITVGEQFDDIMRYRNYLSGGVTVSGGEPLLQPEFVAALLEKCRAAGIHGAIDTSGGVAPEAAQEAIRAAELILLDVKAFNRIKALQLCGIDTNHTQRLLDYCESIEKPVWIRHVLLPGVTLIEKDEDGRPFTDRDQFLLANADLADGINRLKTYTCVQKIELLPFHKMGEHKWKELGLPYAYFDVDEPAEHVLAWCVELLQ